MRQAPTGVKRHAVTENRLASQQRLKTGKRGERMHFVYLIEHIDDIRLCRETIRPAQRVSRAGFALAVAAGHIRVGLEDDIRLWIAGANGTQQCGDCTNIPCAACKRRVITDLAGHQQNPAARC